MRQAFLLRLLVLDRRRSVVLPDSGEGGGIYGSSNAAARKANTLHGGSGEDFPREPRVAFVDVGLVVVPAHDGAPGELERIAVFDHGRAADDPDVFAASPRITVTLV